MNTQQDRRSFLKQKLYGAQLLRPSQRREKCLTFKQE